MSLQSRCAGCSEMPEEKRFQRIKALFSCPESFLRDLGQPKGEGYKQASSVFLSFTE